MNLRKISICIPNWNRYEMVIEATVQVINDDRVGEVVIYDDASTDGCFERLQEFYKYEPKVLLYQSDRNEDCYASKVSAIAYSNYEWCILLDSDNVISKEYLDIIFSYEWDANCIYTPSFAAPNFNFRDYSGLVVSSENVAQYVDKPMFETMLNAANYFVYSFYYLKMYNPAINPMTSDSIFMIYNWLKSGRHLYVVPGLTYMHRVHSGSHYQTKNHLTEVGFHEGILQKLIELK